MALYKCIIIIIIIIIIITIIKGKLNADIALYGNPTSELWDVTWQVDIRDHTVLPCLLYTSDAADE